MDHPLASKLVTLENQSNVGLGISILGLRNVTIRSHQSVANQKTCTSNSRPDLGMLFAEAHRIDAVDVTNGIAVAVQ